MSKQRHAFTLVELLVVIGIIALLLSILVPVLGKAKEAANSAKCLSNMRQVGVATMMYVNDNKSKWLPPYKAAEVTKNYIPSGEAGGYSGALFYIFLSGRYFKEDPKMWICPTDRFTDTRPYVLRLYSNVRDANSSYMMNLDAPHFREPANPAEPGLYPPPFDHTTWFYPRPLKYVKKPSDHLIYWEGAVTASGSAGMASYRSTSVAMRFDHRKRTSMTIGFADGHADQLPASDILLRPNETTTTVPTRMRALWNGSPNYKGIMQIEWGKTPPF